METLMVVYRWDKNFRLIKFQLVLLSGSIPLVLSQPLDKKKELITYKKVNFGE